MNFSRAFQFVIGEEGGFTDDPNDRGNWSGGAPGKGELLGTKYGIAANTYGVQLKAAGKSIRDLTLADAMEIYRRDWWNKMFCDALPAKFRLPLFSAAINCGMTTAAKWLQTSVGATADGHIGEKTISAAQKSNPDRALDGFYTQWLAHYDKIIARNPSQKKYIKGWQNRVQRTKDINSRLA